MDKPSLPSPKSPLADYYVLWYIKNIPHQSFAIFEAPGFDNNFPGVIAKAKNYCEAMSFRFLIVRPLVTDLDREMMRQRSGG